MMFCDEVQKVMSKYIEEHDAASSRLSDIEERRRRETISGRMADEEREKVISDDRAAYSEAVASINRIRDEYLGGLAERYAMKSEDLDAGDVSLLNSQVRLDERDLKRLASKHAGNISMMRCIADRAEREHVYLDGYFSEDARRDEASSYADSAINAIRDVATGAGGIHAAMLMSQTPAALQGE